MKVSVIISTYNGAHKISDLLDNLVKQTIRDFEVIVVIDGSTDNTLSVVESYMNSFATIRTIWQKNSGRSKVRNQGAKEAVGE
jgi:glycosyltransferase involved in cell wall biosynthesis